MSLLFTSCRDPSTSPFLCCRASSLENLVLGADRVGYDDKVDLGVGDATTPPTWDRCGSDVAAKGRDMAGFLIDENEPFSMCKLQNALLNTADHILFEKDEALIEPVMSTWVSLFL